MAYYGRLGNIELSLEETFDWHPNQIVWIENRHPDYWDDLVGMDDPGVSAAERSLYEQDKKHKWNHVIRWNGPPAGQRP